MILFYLIILINHGLCGFYKVSRKIGCGPYVSPELHEFEDGYYFLETYLKLNWFNAVEYCNSFGMELLVVRSSEVLDFLAGRIADRANASESFWTSGNNLQATGTYAWWSTVEKLGFDSTVWAAGHPSDTESNRCLMLSAVDAFRVAAANCYDHHLVVCEIMKYSFC